MPHTSHSVRKGGVFGEELCVDWDISGLALWQGFFKPAEWRPTSLSRLADGAVVVILVVHDQLIAIGCDVDGG